MEMVLFSVLPLLPRGAAKAVIFKNVFGAVQRTVPKTPLLVGLSPKFAPCDGNLNTHMEIYACHPSVLWYSRFLSSDGPSAPGVTGGKPMERRKIRLGNTQL